MEKRIAFRPATLEERNEFYLKEFSINKVKRWFKMNKMELPQICSLDAGSESGIIKDKKFKGQMLYFPFSELKEKVLEYLPEDVYYDRNTYENPEKVLKTLRFRGIKSQELVFDVDSDNIECVHKNKENICGDCLEKAYVAAIKIRKELLKKFREINIVYSGRGFHVYVNDKKAFMLSFKERGKLNKKFANYPIDSWVSRGHIRLIRMPYSLHALVSRKVIPLDGERFEKRKSIPRFFKSN